MGVQLHHGSERGGRSRPQIELRVREVSCETGEIPAPEREAGKARRKSRANRDLKRVEVRELIASPEDRQRLRASRTGAAEEQTVLAASLLQVVVIRTNVALRVAVVHGGTRA